MVAAAEVLDERALQAEREAFDAYALLEFVEQHAPIGLGIYDREFRVRRVNDVLARVSGIAAEDQIGKRLADVVPQIWQQVEPHCHRVVDDEIAVELPEVTGISAEDGTALHTWRVTLYPLWSEGQVTGVGSVVIDTTSEKRLLQGQRALVSSVVNALSAAVEVRDRYTAGHQRRVALVAVALANELGLSAQDVDDIELAAKVHDIGKVAVPAELLARPDALTKVEMSLIREHARMGFEILTNASFPTHLATMVIQHHERIDGSGYPDGLRDDEICLGARIIAVADVLDAMASARPYRGPLGIEPAIAEIQFGSGSRYDENAASACLRLFREGRLPIGA